MGSRQPPSLPDTSHMDTQTGCMTMSPALCRAKPVGKAFGSDGFGGERLSGTSALKVAVKRGGVTKDDR